MKLCLSVSEEVKETKDTTMIVNDKNDENIDLDEDNIKVWERSFLITHAEGFVNKGELHLVS